MQEFTFAINVECLHSSLHAKLLVHNCTQAKTFKSMTKQEMLQYVTNAPEGPL